MPETIHPARLLHDPLPVVFTAQSARTAFMKHHICRFVLRQGRVPINPFTSFEYFLLDTVPRDTIRRANNTLIRRSDELWVFGVIADGVLEEIRLAKKLDMPIRYFSLGQTFESIAEINIDQLEYEPGVENVAVLR